MYQSTLSTSKGGTPRNWIRLYVITDVSDRKVTVNLDKDKIYEFVVTATNKYGESLKEEEKIKKIKVGGRYYLICHYYCYFFKTYIHGPKQLGRQREKEIITEIQISVIFKGRFEVLRYGPLIFDANVG